MNIQFPFSMAIFGRPRSGKSYFIKYLLNSYRDKYDHVVLISPTVFNGDYDFLKDRSHTMSNTNDFNDKIKLIMDKQKHYKQQFGHCNRIILIFDDCAGLIKESKVITNLMSSYRHFNCSVLFVGQYVFNVQSVLRDICTYAVIFNQNNRKSLKECYDSYFGHINTFNEFKDWFCNALCQKYTFCFVNNDSLVRTFMRCP